MFVTGSFTVNNIVDITVTLTFICVNTVNNPNDNHTHVEPMGLHSRLRSIKHMFSWWSYFSRQVAEVGDIDVLSPMYLHSSTTDGSNFVVGLRR
jgi:hypothetical protein